MRRVLSTYNPLFVLVIVIISLKFTIQSPMNRNLPGSPIVEDVNWSDLEDIIPLEDSIKDYPREHPQSSHSPPLTGILPGKKRKLFSPDEVLSPEEKAERRRKIKTARRKELRAEKKAKDAAGHAAMLKANNEIVKKRKLALTDEERRKSNERSRVRQQRYRQQSKEKTGFATNFYAQIRQIKQLAASGQANDEQLSRLARYTERQKKAQKARVKISKKSLANS
ncbi:uncharacterized protein FA14DRAFT_183126 [Meira miltonrushii]|uniref:Uncharacterized protein n=1 Tax=Meira miltonrushii TaxID=1280837 RepID=A0A316VGP4_9BASI|nr:uncharacterized protein FA14DRAFT_183126 [Meira miltonrushii]PWN36680.1 hypothetical protein FA14DRAFT_183126 [Meira miltonrushii]